MASFLALRAHAAVLWRTAIPLAILSAHACLAGDPQQAPPGDLTEASLETLMNMEVSSPARKEQKLSQTAAAVYVITQEDIRRSGATSIPDLLRMVPGLQVAQIDADSWAVTSRGFNGRYADKMLVMIDGRSIYNHMYSGVYWEQNMVPLEDIERIEVIRGPGATMWGANAVNGVINIITKPARETQGLQVSTATGDQERASESIRYGGSVGSHASYRVDAGYFNEGPFSGPGGEAGYGHSDTGHGGGRLDWQISARDSLSVEADASRGGTLETVYPNYPMINLSAPVPDQVTFSSEYFLTHWTHHFSARSDMAWQFSLSDQERTEGFGRSTEWTADLDFQHHYALSARHDLMWGMDLRLYENHETTRDVFPAPTAVIQFTPSTTTDPLANLFAQDQIALRPDALSLTLGVMEEHNPFTGFEIQPSARLLWNLTPRQQLWTAVSRAVRTPALYERDLNIDFQLMPGAVVGTLTGNPDLKSETALSYEAGYRNQPARWVTLDLAAFFTNYANLRTFDIGAPMFEPGPVLVVPMQFGDEESGHTYGVELATNWSLAPKWRVSANYSWFRFGLTGSVNPRTQPLDTEGASPAHQVQFRSQWDISRQLTFDTEAYVVSALYGAGVPGYVRTDARLGWRVSHAAEISVVGQNLLNGRHLEFWSNDYVQCREPGRTAYVKVTWAF